MTLVIQEKYFSFETETIKEKIERLTVHRNNLMEQYGNTAASEREKCVLLEFDKDIKRLKTQLSPKNAAKEKIEKEEIDKKNWGYLGKVHG